MSTKRNNTKDVRIVVRIEKPEANWLSAAAERSDCSISRIVRIAVRKLRERQEAGQESFSQLDLRLGEFSLAA